ncbi:MAG: PHP domain-containing protein [Desulfonatronovibrionaceae bacterium]
MPEIDLHTHSTASDGTYSPKELVELAIRKGLRALALTDHDTTAGLNTALNAARKGGLEFVPGCELSVVYPGTMHIVGLWIPPRAPILNKALNDLREKRHNRNQIIVDKLASLGIDITYDEVRELAGEASVGRPHLARVLVQKQAVDTVQQAFDDFLGPKGQAYVPKEKLTPEKGIELLKKEGATVILAHPITLDLDKKTLRRELTRLKQVGLDGMEVYYSEHPPKHTEMYRGLCQELDLLPSGGSDFHGAVKPDIHLGIGRGNLDIPYSLLETMKKRRREQGLPVFDA